MILAFTGVMLLVHTVGTPLTYAYLFFYKFKPQLSQLQAQELSDYHKEQMDGNSHLSDDEKEVLVPLGTTKRVDAKQLLPGYVRTLTNGYEYRTYWFEIFESVRKVLLVGVPAAFPGRGGNFQLIWGLMVCFLTFGAYMMYQPFIREADDHLQQIAQAQIFITLTASISLRMTPPDETISSLISVTLFIIPLFAAIQETPIFQKAVQMYREATWFYKKARQVHSLLKQLGVIDLCMVMMKPFLSKRRVMPSPSEATPVETSGQMTETTVEDLSNAGPSTAA